MQAYLLTYVLLEGAQEALHSNAARGPASRKQATLCAEVIIFL